MRLLWRVLEPPEIEALCRRALEDAPQRRRIERRASREDPQILPGGVPDDGVVVISAEIDDPVVAIESAEVHRQLRGNRAIGNFGAGYHLSQLAGGAAQPTGVGDDKLVFGRELVARGGP